MNTPFIPASVSSGLSIFIKIIRYPLLFLISGLICKGLFLVPVSSLVSTKFLKITQNTGDILLQLSWVSLIYFILIAICERYQTYLLNRGVQVAVSIIHLVKNALALIFSLLALNECIQVYPIKVNYLQIIHNLTFIVCIAAVAWVLLQILSITETIIYNKYVAQVTDKEERKKVSLYTKFHILRYIAQSLIIVLAVAACLMVFNSVRNLGISLLASAGFLTAILALAAQKSLGSLMIGIQMVLSQPIEIGDLVIIENESGLVEEITLTYVIIKARDSRRLIYPISYFIDKPFQNWSRASEGVSGSINLYISYQENIEEIREYIQSVLAENPLWDKHTFKLIISDFKENKVELNITIGALTPNALECLQSSVRENIFKYLREKNASELV